MYTKILIPLDGSKTAEKVLPYARYFAGKLKLPIELLAVIDMAEMASHIPAEKARFFDSMIEEGVHVRRRQCEMHGRKRPSRRGDPREGRDGHRHADLHGDPWSLRTRPLFVG